MDEKNERVAYIKSHIEDDLKVNKRISGRDYSIQLAGILQGYLSHADNERSMLLGAIMVVGELEEKLRRETGKLVTFHETKKCGIVIHDMYKECDVTGFVELQEHVKQLIQKGHTPLL